MGSREGVRGLVSPTPFMESCVVPVIKINYIIVITKILNPEGHKNPISGLKFTTILLKWWIWPIGEVVLGRVCACSLRSKLVYIMLPFVNQSNVKTIM